MPLIRFNIMANMRFEALGVSKLPRQDVRARNTVTFTAKPNLRKPPSGTTTAHP